MKTYDRRRLLAGASALAAAGAIGMWPMTRTTKDAAVEIPQIVGKAGDMPYRKFGRTGLEVSELSFGSWAIGGASYGGVEVEDSLAALARAEQLGCNLVDTAGVYGDAELVLGRFLARRRNQWLVSTKFSGQPAGMSATLDAQLARLGIDYVDIYLVHWMPRGKDAALLDELEGLRRAGKARFIGVSLYTHADVDDALGRPALDAVMLPFSLLDPDPFLASREKLAASGKAVMARSVLKMGFLTGKFGRGAKFQDPADQRSQLSAAQVDTLADQVDKMRFLEEEAGSLLGAAIAYPLSYPEISTTVLGVKTPRQAELNFGAYAGKRLSAQALARVSGVQDELGLRTSGWLRRFFAKLRA